MCAPTATAAKVVDTSALAAQLFGEPEAVAERLGDGRLVAPTLLGFELANVCLIHSRRHPDSGRRFLPRSGCVTGWRWGN